MKNTWFFGNYQFLPYDVFFCAAPLRPLTPKMGEPLASTKNIGMKHLQKRSFLNY
jgi:hypothetical protein